MAHGPDNSTQSSSEDQAVLGVKLSAKAHRDSLKFIGWKVLAWGLTLFAVSSIVFLAVSTREDSYPNNETSHRRLSWNASPQTVLLPNESEQDEPLVTELKADPLCPSCPDISDAESVPPWPAPEMAAVGFAMQKHLSRLDNKAGRVCHLQRSRSVQWINHSNYDNLTRWRNPGIPTSFFDHEISFKYERIKGKKPKLEDTQCFFLMRGQNYSYLRQNPLVQAQPFTAENPFGPVIPDKDLKLVAVVFPQFYAFKENDRFWGTNFTEWTNIKLTFFNPWNFQPIKHPIQAHGGYYNFLDYDHRKRVGELARFYGIEALAFHHYWFDCNTIFLEKVVLKMMEDGQPDIPFMLIWANEAWTRHWTGVTGDVLQTQAYGNSSCWEEHFQWLLPVFKHPKYLKVQGKPVFSIYLTTDMRMLKAMIVLWKKLALKEGLPGLHIVQCLGHKDRGANRHVDALFEYQPNLRRGRLRFKFKDQRLLDFHYRGEYLGWDNYPRHNSDPKFIVGDLDDDPIHVEARLEARMSLARRFPNDGPNLFFLIAWNEWGEGNILEPNNVFGYGNLNALAVAYERSRSTQRTDMQVLDDLLDVMDDCKLQVDVQYYTDLAHRQLDHLWRSAKPEDAILDDWEEEGFRRGREFRLVADPFADPLSSKPHCQKLTAGVLDKTVVRFLLDIANIRKAPSSTLPMA